MAITKYEGRTGGKICKWPQQRVPFIPYNRPPSAARGICRPPPANEAARSGWFSKLVDPAVRAIVRSVSPFFSSIFRKGLAATPGQNTSTIEEVPKVISSVEISGQGGNFIDIKLSIRYDGSDTTKQKLLSQIDAIFQRERVRVGTDHLHSRSIGASTLPLTCFKNEETISKDSNINPSSLHQVVKLKEKEKGVNVNIREKDFESPIGIARTCMSSKLRRPPSVVGRLDKIWHRGNAKNGNELVNPSIAFKSLSRFPSISAESQNIYMTPKPPRRSTLYKWARFPYFGSSVLTNPMQGSPHKGSNVGPTRTLKWTTLPSNIGHFDHRQALKRRYSDMNEGCSDDARRVRQRLI